MSRYPPATPRGGRWLAAGLAGRLAGRAERRPCARAASLPGRARPPLRAGIDCRVQVLVFRKLACPALRGAGDRTPGGYAQCSRPGPACPALRGAGPQGSAGRRQGQEAPRPAIFDLPISACWRPTAVGGRRRPPVLACVPEPVLCYT